MEIQELELNGVKLFVPQKFKDDRGVFWETWRADMLMNEQGEPITFVQDNLSISQLGVLRGLHFQHAPNAQGKLVRAVSGRILDVALDLRATSSTRGQYVCQELSADNGHQLWVPEGFAHGFLALENNSTVEYRCTVGYHPESEGSIRWDDPDIGIDWKQEGHVNLDEPILSPKDRRAPLLNDIDWPF